MRIVFVTDLHGSTEFLGPLIDREAPGADLLLLGGDLTNFEGAPRARAVVNPLRRAFPRVLAVPGNVDRPEVLDWLVAEGLSLHGAGLVLDGVGLSGCGGSNHTPLHSPTEFDEDTLAALLAQGAEAARLGSPWLLVTHVPPADTITDRMFAGKHVGSPALRAFLEAGGPALCLCGHIHEGVGLDRVGAVQVCNPGALTSLRYAVIHVDPIAATARPELRTLDVPRALRARAGARMIARKVWGYARHRLGQ
ncbi:MAG: metallophosphoesterase [bacterium]